MKKWKDFYKYTHVKAPIEMCNYVVREKLENPFRLFIYLPLSFSIMASATCEVPTAWSLSASGFKS